MSWTFILKMEGVPVIETGCFKCQLWVLEEPVTMSPDKMIEMNVIINNPNLTRHIKAYPNDHVIVRGDIISIAGFQFLRVTGWTDSDNWEF